MTDTEQKPGSHVDISGRRLARNTMLNLAGRVAPLLLAIFTVPYVIHHLGPDRYGLYSLAWIVVGYFALFNLGMGPATTKFVAELLGKGETEKLPELTWTAAASQTGLGIFGGILLAVSSPFLVSHVLKIPAALHSQAYVIFLIMAALLPFDFAGASLGGVLGASQRFDLLNAIGIPASCLTYLLPVVVLALGFGLPAIMISLGVVRIVSLFVTLAMCIRLYPSLRRVRFDFRLVRSLLGYGGWVTVSTAISPILAYFDRILLGAIISVAAVGYYAPPFLISSKLSILSGSLVPSLFPAFSASAGRGDTVWIRKTLIRSLKFLTLILGPAALLLSLFARPLLTLWLGTKFASEGTTALQLLAVGVVANSFASVAGSVSWGAGRPDIPAKFHIVELPIHIVLTWFLIRRFGLSGAALAWTIRTVLDFLLLLLAACWLTRTSPRLLVVKDLRRAVGALVALAAGLFVIELTTPSVAAEVFFALLLSTGFVLTAWKCVLNIDEKGQILHWLRAAQ